MAGKKQLGLAAAAEAVGVHPATIIRWLKERRVLSVKRKKNARGHWVFTDVDVTALKSYKESIQDLD